MSNSTRPSSNSTSTSYDERFVVPLEASRRGAHRARVSPVMAVLPVAAVVGIVIGAIALVYLFLGGMGGSDTTTTTAAPPPSASPTAAASTAAAPSTSPSAPASGMATDGAVDKTVTVAVYNGTLPSVSGLARKASTRLSTAGWTLGKVETWTGIPVTETTVSYGATAQRATAMAVAKSLGRGVAKLSASKAGTGIAVVVGNDYPGAGAARPTGTVTHATNSKATAAGGFITRSTGKAATAKATAKATATTTVTPTPTTTSTSTSTSTTDTTTAG